MSKRSIVRETTSSNWLDSWKKILIEMKNSNHDLRKISWEGKNIRRSESSKHFIFKLLSAIELDRRFDILITKLKKKHGNKLKARKEIRLETKISCLNYMPNYIADVFGKLTILNKKTGWISEFTVIIEVLCRDTLGKNNYFKFKELSKISNWLIITIPKSYYIPSIITLLKKYGVNEIWIGEDLANNLIINLYTTL